MALPWRCAWGFHDWGRWSEPYETIHATVQQQRRCATCNRASTTGDWSPRDAPQPVPVPEVTRDHAPIPQIWASFVEQKEQIDLDHYFPRTVSQ